MIDIAKLCSEDAWYSARQPCHTLNSLASCADYLSPADKWRIGWTGHAGSNLDAWLTASAAQVLMTCSLQLFTRRETPVLHAQHMTVSTLQ